MATTHEIQVLINGLPHVMLARCDLLGVQSFIKSTGPAVPMYFIVFTMVGGHEIAVDYDERLSWEKVLRALRDARIFDERFGERIGAV